MVTKVELTEALAAQSIEIQQKLDESVSAIRAEIIDKLTEENKKLYEKIEQQDRKIIDLEKRFEQNLQYQRYSSVLVSGIPMDVQHQNLEGIIIKLFNTVCYHIITNRDIVAVHRVSKTSAKVLVKFVNKRDATCLLESKNALAELDVESIGLGNCEKIFVDEHLTPYISKLAYLCRCLKRTGKIVKTNVSKGYVQILKYEDGRLNWYDILHTVDINYHFPDFDIERGE